MPPASNTRTSWPTWTRSTGPAPPPSTPPATSTSTITTATWSSSNPRPTSAPEPSSRCPPKTPPTTCPPGSAVDTAIGGNVYVDNRTYISVYDQAGNPVLSEGQPLRIGAGSLGDGYGVAVSQYFATAGRLYVPDASSNTVKVYDPAIDKVNPVAEIKNPAGEPFSSLRDAAIAVDKETGDVYFTDNLQPTFTEQPQAMVYVYNAANVYKGHLKYNVVDGLPVGLAVDNGLGEFQGRVYVTSGNTNASSVYSYAPGATTTAAPLPPLGSGLPLPGAPGGSAVGGTALASPRAASAVEQPSPRGGLATTSTVTQKENLRVSVSGKLAPKRLPRTEPAPISVSVGWKIGTVDETAPPKLKGLRIEINRHGQFDYTGLPTCPYAKIQPATTQRALSNCRAALVGQGTFTAIIALKGQEGESYETTGKLLVFNGEEHGKPVLFGQIYSAHPFATSFVIPFKVKKISKGTYGTALSATLPKSLLSWGNLTGIEMKLERRFGFEGEQRSYISAGCPAPKGFGLASFSLARTAFSFAGGKELSSVVTGNCKVRG